MTPETPAVYISIAFSVLTGALGALASFLFLKYRMRQAEALDKTQANSQANSQEKPLAVLITEQLEKNTQKIEERISIIIDSSYHKILLAVKDEIKNSQEVAIQPIWEELQGHRDKISDLSERVARLEESKKIPPRKYGKR